MRTDLSDRELDALRRAWALADDDDAAGSPGSADSETAGARSGVATDRVWRAAAGELSPEEVAELADAAARDPELARSWRLARELQSGAAVEVSGSKVLPFPVRAAPARWAVAAILVAGIGLAFVVGFERGLFRGPDTSAVRGAGSEGSTIGALTPEGARLSRADFRLRWTPLAAERCRYDIRVSTADLELVAEAEALAAAEYRLPTEALARLPAGARLFWQVDARCPDGRVETSPAFAVVLDD
jgi:hypothetical protein